MRSNRVVCMVMAAAMFASAAVVRAAERKDGDKGTFIGKVAEKGANWIRVKNDAGTSERFTPHWKGGLPKDGGGFDKDMVEKIKSTNVGDKVEISWDHLERLRVTELKILEKSTQ